jgi:hypothetical protein
MRPVTAKAYRCIRTRRGRRRSRPRDGRPSLASQDLVLRVVRLFLGDAEQPLGPHVLGPQDRQSDEDQQPAGPGQNQERHAHQNNDDPDDRDGDATAVPGDEEGHHLERHDRGVVVPASSHLGVDRRDLGHDFTRVALLGVVAPNVMPVEVVAHELVLCHVPRRTVCGARAARMRSVVRAVASAAPAVIIARPAPAPAATVVPAVGLVR